LLFLTADPNKKVSLLLTKQFKSLIKFIAQINVHKVNSPANTACQSKSIILVSLYIPHLIQTQPFLDYRQGLH